MMMKASLALLLAASAVWGAAPAMALPPLDDFEIELRGEAQGWLNATCTYYDIDWLSEEQSRKAIQRLMTLIKGDYLGEDLAGRPRRWPWSGAPAAEPFGLRPASDGCIAQVEIPEPCQAQFRPPPTSVQPRQERELIPRLPSKLSDG